MGHAILIIFMTCVVAQKNMAKHARVEFHTKTRLKIATMAPT